MNTLLISDTFEPYYVGKKSLTTPTRAPAERSGPAGSDRREARRQDADDEGPAGAEDTGRALA